MIERSPRERQTLVVRVQTCVCAVPLAYVIETMRSLRIEPVAGVPAFVLGVSIIRGVPMPVIDLGVLLGVDRGTRSRFVTLRLGDRQVALSVDAVLGIRQFDALAIQELPPLLQGISQDAIHAIGTLDHQMLVVLRDGWQLPGEVLHALAARNGSQ